MGYSVGFVTGKGGFVVGSGPVHGDGWQRGATVDNLRCMFDPLSLTPMALAAAGAKIDRFESAQLVAAGVTLLQRSAPLVRALHGRRAAILLPTVPSFFTALAASDGRGAVLINPMASKAEIAWQLQDANVGTVFTNSALSGRLPAGTPHVLLDNAPVSAQVVTPDRTHEVDLGSHFGLSLKGELGTEGSTEELAVIYTSAMNGIPRGARITHRNVLSNAHAVVQATALTPADHSLVCLPFAHMFGLVVAAVAPILGGARVSTMDRFHPARALELIKQNGVTFLSGVPAMYHAMAQLIERSGEPFRGHALRVCIVGGAPLDAQLQDKWAELTGVEMRQGFGLTEAGPVCTFNRIDQPNARGSVGTAFPGVDVAILATDSDAMLPNGETGEIAVRGPNVFAGYVNQAADALQFSGEWLRTGDLGWKREDGVFFFAGVRKRMFTRNGFNIYPGELERAVKELPGVTGAEVSAIQNASRGNDMQVSYTGSASEKAVLEWCRERLASYKLPTVVVRVS